jgi:hypothetical protein
MEESAEDTSASFSLREDGEIVACFALHSFAYFHIISAASPRVIFTLG